MVDYLTTVGGYAALFGLGYVLYHVSTRNNKKRPVTALAKTIPKAPQPEARKDDRKKKQRMENFVSEVQDSSSKASKPKASGKAPEPAWLSNAADHDSSDDVDNREFARQLAKAKEGTKLAAKTEGGKQREKSVKQSRANKMSNRAEEKESAPSSTTGADADDDQSPAVSPEVGPASAGDISDMLEPTRTGPSVLRLTDTAPKKQNKKPAKAPEPVESKKQRQNRKKAEAAKEARLEAEKERKGLEEKQRRQARIAEGRAAKDGSQFTTAAVKSSSWTQGAPGGITAPAPSTNGFHAPLDTFEKSTPSAAKPVTGPKPAEDHWAASLPSEEEQMELLKSEDDEWSTVKTKSKKTSKKDSSIDSGDEPLQSRPAAQPKQPVAGKASQPTQSFGSFSAFASKDEPVEEEEEEEWDV
ncbi:Fc.00g066190.m01.CDS01 [Cosmosporella sp. VM-42]